MWRPRRPSARLALDPGVSVRIDALVSDFDKIVFRAEVPVAAADVAR